jgi:hypothetical protein
VFGHGVKLIAKSPEIFQVKNLGKLTGGLSGLFDMVLAQTVDRVARTSAHFTKRDFAALHTIVG